MPDRKVIPIESARGSGGKPKPTREIVYDAWKGDDNSLEAIHNEVLHASVDEKGHSDRLPQIRMPQGTMGTISEIIKLFPEYRTGADFVRTAVHRSMRVHHEQIRQMESKEGWKQALHASHSYLLLTRYEQEALMRQHSTRAYLDTKDRIDRYIAEGLKETAARELRSFGELVEDFELLGGMDEDIMQKMQDYYTRMHAVLADHMPKKTRPTKTRVSKAIQ